MVSRVVFWAGFGVAVRAWQLGLQMVPLFHKQGLWAYPFFGAVGGSFGYWLQGVDDRQTAMLAQRKELLLEKRARRAQKLESAEAEAAAH
ncbi:hypothetical protein PpBr36_04508 [Pyricularia pennisetigena]|uniref:hypothetical protein n=1 Tax=Pyricularia pennisetigena TaxID=1578925 RepID=UPI00114F8899|nr:hypothetical protein PpBr36_04508 [Pyricularia pennisetigena]TLS26182.1 hypothetical protein PpBr36_04508 [Pyricularia pennisetigena]